VSISFFSSSLSLVFLPKTEKKTDKAEKKRNRRKKPFENSRLKTKRVHGSEEKEKRRGKKWWFSN
jgi:hypothetical protein